jgi:hypothetical protein
LSFKRVICNWNSPDCITCQFSLPNSLLGKDARDRAKWIEFKARSAKALRGGAGDTHGQRERADYCSTTKSLLHVSAKRKIRGPRLNADTAQILVRL